MCPFHGPEPPQTPLQSRNPRTHHNDRVPAISIAPRRDSGRPSARAPQWRRQHPGPAPARSHREVAGADINQRALNSFALTCPVNRMTGAPDITRSRGDRPIYVQLAEQIADGIRSGALLPGDRVASEPELMRQHSISRATAVRALEHLEQQG